jgi:putative FmdB family regulatory protein
MPLYEYQCDGCGSVFEVMQKFSDTPLTVHEQCGGQVHRLLSAPALQFKGSGWYITDYARGAKSADNGSKSSESKPDGAAKSESKSDSGTSSTTSSASQKES